MNYEISQPETRPTSPEPAPEPAAECHSAANNGTSCQSLQLRESRNGKGITRGWITESEWTIYIEENSIDDPRLPSHVSIFRVPYLLKKSKIEFYVPETVSLGPYHHRNAELHDLMSSHKGRALHLTRTRVNNNRNRANDPNNMDFAHRARDEIKKLEKEIRDSYEEKIDCDVKTLALMLSLDGCFILQILRSLRGNIDSNCYEPMFEKDYNIYSGNDILADIVKLENQIPMIVLHKLLQLEFDSLDKRDYLLKFLRRLLGRFYPVDSKDAERLWLWPQGVVHHILGLMHSFIVSSLSDHDDPVAERDLSACAVNNVIRIRSAIELKYAGIQFKACCAAGGTRMIRFDPKNATIFLPRIRIVDSTELLFRNLIAFEMCKPSKINYVTCYVFLMDELIDTEEDVALLKRSGIVTNLLGNDAQAAELFNCLSKDVTINTVDAFKELKRDVDDHYQNVMKVQLAELVKDHWKTVAFPTTLLIVLLTTVQTIFSVLSVYK